MVVKGFDGLFLIDTMSLDVQKGQLEAGSTLVRLIGRARLNTFKAESVTEDV